MYHYDMLYNIHYSSRHRLQFLEGVCCTVTCLPLGSQVSWLQTLRMNPTDWNTHHRNHWIYYSPADHRILLYQLWTLCRPHLSSNSLFSCTLHHCKLCNVIVQRVCFVYSINFRSCIICGMLVCSFSCNVFTLCVQGHSWRPTKLLVQKWMHVI